MDNDIYKRGLIIVGGILIILITIFGYKLSQKQEALKIQSSKIEQKSSEQNVYNEKSNDEIIQPVQQIVIDINGAVVNPGVYTLDLGARLNDAINIAGGFSEEVNTDYVSKHINRSRVLSDSEKIYIPLLTDNVDTDLDKSLYDNDYISTESDNKSITGKININTADKNELMMLNGIGEVYSQRIIDYRREHPFKSIEDIKNVKGIGDKTFEKIKDSIVVE